jgi:SAM-dependent methyltransferase
LGTRGNLDYNRALWDSYSHSWDDPSFRRSQADPRLQAPGAVEGFRVLGEEWALEDDLEEVISEFIRPFVTRDSRAAEIGVGGGRVATRVAPLVAHLVCMDVSPRMLKRAEEALRSHRNVELVLLESSRIPERLNGSLDFIYSFDVFMHLDLHTMWRYVLQMAKALHSGGQALVHVPNLAAPDGWRMFAGQHAYSIEDGWFITPDTIRTLADHAGLELIKESRPNPDNLYFNRDYLAVLRKPAATVSPPPGSNIAPPPECPGDHPV